MNADLFDIFEGGNAFQNPLTSLSSGSTSLASSNKSGLTTFNSVSDSQVKAALTAGGLSSAKITTGTNLMTTATTGVGTLVTYGDQSVSEAFTRINTTTAYTNGLTGIGRPPTSCDTVNSAFGVIQQKGAEWLASMESALNAVGNKIAELQALIAKGIAAGVSALQAAASAVSAAIDTAVTAVNKIIADIQAGIAAELAVLEKMVNSCVSFCMSSQLGEWMKDSCVAGAIQKMATPTLKTMIS